MCRTIAIGVLLLTAPAYAASLQVTAQDPAGHPLPASRVALLALSDDASDCRVVQQVVTTDPSGVAMVDASRPGLYMVAVELAGFIGTEIGPFRVEARSTEAPDKLIAVLQNACPICVSQPATNDYVLAKRCRAEDPSQAITHEYPNRPDAAALPGPPNS